jgi:malate dehydrogenase (oxaloacetate-decarboxylating)
MENYMETIKTKLRGFEVLSKPELNKGTAFSESERQALGLTGLLPSAVLSMEEQLARSYANYKRQPSDLAKNIYLTDLRNRNRVLFYKLLISNLTEMLPIIYTPTIGLAIERYSKDFHSPQGVFLSIDKPDKIEESFINSGFTADDVDLIVATDAEGILGIGDWGAGGIDISIGKLTVYTAAAGINPNRVIPVMLDVGTNNEGLLNDPFYVGYRHSRVRGERYDAFIDAYVTTVKKLFPKALLHWEDFGTTNARRIVLKYRKQAATFNDDMQGTGATALAALLNALKVAGTPITEAKIIMFGAGTAGVGIADQFRDAMIREGLTHEQAVRQFWLVDRQGLLLDDMDDSLIDFQKPYARPAAEVAGWKRNPGNNGIYLEEVVRQIHPTALMGTSTAAYSFTETIVKEMAAHVKRPIIFPLSNPTSLSEACPSDLIEWTDGHALVVTGSPFPAVEHDGVTYVIGQSNNAFLFPGLGLGTIVAQASEISDGMFWAAAQALSKATDLSEKGAPLLPRIDELRQVSAAVAVAVAETAAKEGLAQLALTDVVQQVQDAIWNPEYSLVEGV